MRRLPHLPARSPLLLLALLLALALTLASAAAGGGPASAGLGPAVAAADSHEDQEPPEDEEPPEDQEPPEEEDEVEGEEFDLSVYDDEPVDEVWQQAIGLPAAAQQAAGRGVTVAVLDTGVSRHPDLGDRVAARVDLTPDADGEDTYGHGAAMAGLVAGDGSASEGRYRGVASGARLLSVRAADWSGATDVSSALAGLEWIAAHHRRYGIRVVSLSFGTDAVQDDQVDPLNHAVQRLWREGVVVVVAAGNRGQGGQGTVDKPGDDPYVVTVGAADTRGTATPADDLVAPFSSRGTADGRQKPDLLAPGINLVSHRAPGSTFDGLRPAARVDEHYAKSTGTSPATAVVAGVAALMLEADPSLTPDAVKAALVRTANAVAPGQQGTGAGLVDAAEAVQVAAAASGGEQGDAPSSGLGTLDASRGERRVWAAWRDPAKPELLTGEVDALGNPWVPGSWATRAWSPETWATSPWARVTAVGEGWSTPGAPASTWGGVAPDAGSFFSRYWHEAGWDAAFWSRYWHTTPWD